MRTAPGAMPKPGTQLRRGRCGSGAAAPGPAFEERISLPSTAVRNGGPLFRVMPPQGPRIARRIAGSNIEQLIAGGIAPLFARIYAARGVLAAAEMQLGLAGLPPRALLLHADRAAVRLADAIA